MTEKDYLSIKSSTKAINRHISEMVVTGYEDTFTESYVDAITAINRIYDIIYEARFKIYHQEEEDVH